MCRQPEGGEPMSEIGWIVLQEFQGRRLGKRAVRMLLELVRDDDHWGSCTPSRRRRTPRQTVSVILLDSGSLVSGA